MVQGVWNCHCSLCDQSPLAVQVKLMLVAYITVIEHHNNNNQKNLTNLASTFLATSPRSITVDCTALMRADQEGGGEALLTQCLNMA